MAGTARRRKLSAAARDARPAKEPMIAQIASFVDLFVWLLMLKAFFLPLFIIPTGSMAETLAGTHSTTVCPNCGKEYDVGLHDRADAALALPVRLGSGAIERPEVVECPNCRFQRPSTQIDPAGLRLAPKWGDRIVVHGWQYDLGGAFAPQRWDVVVFKNPNEPAVNYIKRLIGLPGETIEIIDGDIWVTAPGAEHPGIARKTHHAQQSLWFPYYDHNYRPRSPTSDRLFGRWKEYRPRWEALREGAGWQALDTRAPRFEGPQRAEIEFRTGAASDGGPGLVSDEYGYNGYFAMHRVIGPSPLEIVTDTRLSARFELAPRPDADGGGYVELHISKYQQHFFARLFADGRVTLATQRWKDGSPEGDLEPLGESRAPAPRGPTGFSLSHADYRVVVEVDGRSVIETTPERYAASDPQARRRGALRMVPALRIAAANIEARLQDLLIERDVHYTNAMIRNRAPGNGIQGNPLRLRQDAYFVLGDNSPSSLDGRLWEAHSGPESWMLGPHLRARWEAGEYTLGTVPADQMIGRAFLVYWPGFLPIAGRGPSLLPNLGEVRWIH